MATVTRTVNGSRSGAAVQDDKQHPSELPADNSIEAGTSQFFWTYTEEPHRSRRQAIIKAHPEVLKLCGPEPLTKWLVLAVVALQAYCAWTLRDAHPLSWRFLGTAYVVGATANQNLFLAVHEISHNLAFREAWKNRALAVFANLPIGIPYSASFRPYHLTHHKSLGVDGLDADLPTALEAFFLDSVAGKAFFATFQIFFYALRPMFVYSLPFTSIQLLNIVAQVVFDYALVTLTKSWTPLLYLVASSFFAGSLHPCAAHFIAEHYVFSNADESSSSSPSATSKSQPHDPSIPVPETYSYYGPLNLLTYNVGLHNEHHDFPAVPWTRLPALHSIASEFYKDLPHHRSWTAVLWRFVLDPRVGLWCRVKRKQGGRLVGGAQKAAASSSSAWREEELGANERTGLAAEGVY